MNDQPRCPRRTLKEFDAAGEVAGEEVDAEGWILAEFVGQLETNIVAIEVGERLQEWQPDLDEIESGQVDWRVCAEKIAIRSTRLRGNRDSSGWGAIGNSVLAKPPPPPSDGIGADGSGE